MSDSTLDPSGWVASFQRRFILFSLPLSLPRSPRDGKIARSSRSSRSWIHPFDLDRFGSIWIDGGAVHRTHDDAEREREREREGRWSFPEEKKEKNQKSPFFRVQKSLLGERSLDFFFLGELISTCRTTRRGKAPFGETLILRL